MDVSGFKSEVYQGMSSLYGTTPQQVLEHQEGEKQKIEKKDEEEKLLDQNIKKSS